MPSFFEILVILNGALALSLGIFVLAVNSRNPIYRSFGALTIFFGIWSLANFLPIPVESTQSIALAAASLAVASNLHFVQKLTTNRNIFLTIAFYFAGIILLGFGATMTNTISNWPVSPLDAGGKIWLAGFLIFWTATIFWLFYASRKTIGAKKYQLWLAGMEHLIFSGASVGLFIFTSDPAFPPETNVVSFVNLFGTLHLVFLFYFFVEYNFLKLKIILPNLLKKAIALGFVAIIVVNFQLTSSIVFPDTNSILINLATVIIGVGIFNFIIKIFDQYQLFKIASFKTFRKVVSDFKNQNIFYTSLDDLKTNVQQKFANPAGIKLAKVIVLDFEKNVSLYPKLEKYFAKNAGYLVTVEEEYLQKNKKIECLYLEELKMLGDIVFPLFQNTNELIGFFAIQHSNDNDIYVEEELRLIEGAVHYVALALMGILYTEELHKQSKKLREDYEKLKTLDDAKDSFIANVSHELRTPATAIKGYLEMLAAPNFGKLSEKQKDFVVKIQKNTNWLISLLGDILMITKLDNQKIDFKIKNIAVRPFFESLGAKWQKKIEAKKIHFEFAEPQSDLVLKTDPKWLEEALDRLLGNAVKFTEKGRIKISAEKAGKFLTIKIGDTGVGISQENSDKIFEKFFQTESFLEKGDCSTGLGLAIVKKLVENLNGSISVKSKIDVGSTFQILIPFQNA